MTQSRFSQYSPLLQLVLFILLAIAGYLLFSGIAASVVLAVWGTRVLCVPALLLIQALSSTGAFLLPALWLNRLKGGDYLGLRTGAFSASPLILYCAVFILALGGAYGLEQWSEGWHWENSPWSVLRWFHARSAAAEELAGKILHVDNRGLFLLSILVVGPCAGIFEEFFFRGGVQNLIGERMGTRPYKTRSIRECLSVLKQDKRMHIAVWITAVLFSLVHLDPYGFLPRCLLGAALGYTYFLSGNIWWPVLLHTLNNVIAAFGEFLG